MKKSSTQNGVSFEKAVRGIKGALSCYEVKNVIFEDKKTEHLQESF